VAGEREAVAVVVTCEHASRAVPASLRRRLRLVPGRLQSHRGFDPGARALARSLAARLGAPLVLGRVTRLVVDLNRSPHNPAVFSTATRTLGRDAREALLASWHAPHWGVVQALVNEALADASLVVHLAAHSFAPVLAGKRRDFDVGLLYDPARPREAALVESWRGRLAQVAPWLRVRLNAPYRGVSDGLTTALRRRLPSMRYAGIEVEVNQGLLATPARWREVRRVLADSTAAVVGTDGAAAGAG
jgi:predicted N-formylglutamate amidohydrolase